MAEHDFLQEEMQANGVEFDGSAPSAEEAAAEAKDDRKWYNSEGVEVSKSEFIREQFVKFNKSRKQIAEEFGINYRTVYGATVNMTNDAEPASRGRSASATKIKVTADNRVVTVIDGVTHVDNVAVSDEEAAALGELTEVDRNTWIKQQVEAGRPRGEVAASLGLSYGVVYSMTKEIEGSSQRHELVDEETGEIVSRSELIRRLHGRGMSKSEIAKQLGVEYPVVWSALKSLKSEDEKYLEAVERLAKFADKMEDVDAFNALLAELRNAKLKEDAGSEAVEEAAAAGDGSVYQE